jgi:hypothetical protein
LFGEIQVQKKYFMKVCPVINCPSDWRVVLLEMLAAVMEMQDVRMKKSMKRKKADCHAPDGARNDKRGI